MMLFEKPPCGSKHGNLANVFSFELALSAFDFESR